MRIPVRVEEWEVQCCTRLTVGDRWEPFLRIDGSPTPIGGGHSAEVEKFIVEGDTVALIGNIDRIIGKKGLRGRTALVKCGSLRVFVDGAPKKGGVVVTGQLWNDGHNTEVESDEDAEASTNRGLIAKVERVKVTQRSLIGPLMVSLGEGKRTEFRSTDEFIEDDDDSWVVRVEFELDESGS